MLRGVKYAIAFFESIGGYHEDIPRQGRGPEGLRRQSRRGPRIRLPGKGPGTLLPRFRHRRRRRSEEERQILEEGEGGRPEGRRDPRRGQTGRRRHDAAPRRGPARGLQGARGTQPQGGGGPGVRPRLRDNIQAHRPAQRRGRNHDGPQGPRRHGKDHLHRGIRGSRPHLRLPGRHRQRQEHRPRPRQGTRLDPRGRIREHVRQRDLHRPVRRAVRPVRGPDRADQARLRDSRRGGIPAGDGLLRGPPRDQAHRRPDQQGRLRSHVERRLQHR